MRFEIKRAKQLLIFLCVLGVSAVFPFGCATPQTEFIPIPTTQELQDVFGPAGWKFIQREIEYDLNNDGYKELIRVLDSGKSRDWTRDGVGLEKLKDGIYVDGFIVFDGKTKRIPIFYVYEDYDGFELRLKEIDGNIFLVDETYDKVIGCAKQRIWGRWRYKSDGWPSDEWVCKTRYWNKEKNNFSDWQPCPRMYIMQGK